MNITSHTTLGAIVANNISYANTLYQYNLDFCCGGAQTLSEACEEQNINVDTVIKAIEATPQAEYATALQFDAWRLDLLIDYILKFHHDYIRTEGPKTYQLLDKVCQVHGATNPKLLEVRTLFAASLEDLFSHLNKEEMVLFPFIDEILKAQASRTPLPAFHCGSIENPINAMEYEHAGEGERFRTIAALTDNYTAPEYACESYKLVMDRLKQFEENLHIHIHCENNILFRKALSLQNKCLSATF